jgi:hypothetical protein
MDQDPNTEPSMDNSKPHWLEDFLQPEQYTSISQKEYDEITKEFADIINRHSLENGSNTPDFVLAEYLFDCLMAFNKGSRSREVWYGKSLSPGGGITTTES